MAIDTNLPMIVTHPQRSDQDPNYSNIFAGFVKAGVQIYDKFEKNKKLNRIAGSILDGQKMLTNAQNINKSLTERRQLREKFISGLGDTELSASEIKDVSDALKIDKHIRLTKVNDKWVNVDVNTGAIIGEFGKPEAPSPDEDPAEVEPINKAYTTNMATLDRGVKILANTNKLAEEDIFPAIKDKRTAEKLAGVSLEASSIVTNIQDTLDKLNANSYSGIKNTAQLEDIRNTAREEILANIRKLGFIPMNEGFSDVYDGHSKNNMLAANMPSRIWSALKKDILNQFTTDNYAQLGLTDKDLQDVFSKIDNSVNRYEQVAITRGEKETHVQVAETEFKINELEMEVKKMEAFKALSSVQQEMIIDAEVMKPLLEATTILSSVAGLAVTETKMMAALIQQTVTPKMMTNQLDILENSLQEDGLGFTSIAQLIDPTQIAFMNENQRIRYLSLSDSILKRLEEEMGKETSKAQKQNIESVLNAFKDGFARVQDIANNKQVNEAVKRLKAAMQRIKEAN